MCSVEQLLNLQVKMDSDTDQDEDEVHPSFSVTVSERKSPSCVRKRAGSECNLQCTGIFNNSGNIEETAMEEKNLFFMRDSASGDSLTDTSLFKNEEPPLKVIRVACHRQRRRKPYRSIADDRTFCPEKAVEDAPDPTRDPGKDGEEDNQEEAQTELPGSQDTVPGEVEADGSDTAEPSTPASDTSGTENDNQNSSKDSDRTENVLSNESATEENTTNDSSLPLSEHTDTKSSHSANFTDVKNGTVDKLPNNSGQATENSLLDFQNAITIPVKTVSSEHSTEATGLSAANADIDTAKESSSTGQLAGKKRKYSVLWKTADAEGAVGGSSAENSVSSGDAEEGFENKDSDKDAKKKKNRCAVCRKKVGLTGFECRCGGLFCAVHRYSDKHDCTFDYREMGAQEIRRNNPVVVGEKIQKI